jgi:hypothetical protein
MHHDTVVFAVEVVLRLSSRSGVAY